MVKQIENRNYKNFYDCYEEEGEDGEEAIGLEIEGGTYAIEILPVFEEKPLVPRPYLSDYMEQTVCDVDLLTIKVCKDGLGLTDYNRDK